MRSRNVTDIQLVACLILSCRLQILFPVLFKTAKLLSYGEIATIRSLFVLYSATQILRVRLIC